MTQKFRKAGMTTTVGVFKGQAVFFDSGENKPAAITLNLQKVPNLKEKPAVTSLEKWQHKNRKLLTKFVTSTQREVRKENTDMQNMNALKKLCCHMPLTDFEVGALIWAMPCRYCHKTGIDGLVKRMW